MPSESFTSLVVDDDRLARRFVAEALSAAGHSVTTAACGGEALDLLRERMVDLVVTDWRMPEMDGMELTGQLRELPDGGPGVILVTAGDSGVGPLAFEAGCDDFLVTPVDADELGLRAARVIGERRRRRELARERRRTDRERSARRDAEHVTEQTMARLRSALAEQRELSGLYESLLASAGNGIYGVDLDGRATFVNDAACDELGFSREELVGRKMHELIHHTRPDGSAYPAEDCPVAGTCRAGEAHRIEDEVFFRRDGRPFPVSYTATPIRVEGHITGAVLVFSDATERIAAGAQIRVKNEQLHEQQAELETQNEQLHEQQAELETQNEQLHEQQLRLEERTDELDKQRAELQRLYDRAAAENARMENLYEAARALVVGGADPIALADGTLTRLLESAGAQVGALYLRLAADGPPELVAARGLERERLDQTLSEDSGLPGRALAERSAVEAGHPDDGLRIMAFGQEVAVRRELHVPLTIGEIPIGVATFGWTNGRVLDDGARRALDALVAQAAAGLARAVSERATREREAVIRTVLDATPDGIRLEDPSGRVRFANAAVRSFYSRMGVEVDGASAKRLLHELAAITTDPEGVLSLSDDLDRRLVDEFELVGSGRCYRRYAAPVRDEDEASLGRIVVTRDVTEERRAERIKDEIVATVSHELRTPLTSIIGYTELLDEEAHDHLGEDERHMLAVVDRNARRLLTLVGDLLIVAQAEARELDLIEDECDIAAVAAACVEDARPVAAERAIDLSIEADAPALLTGDSDRLGQAVSNLVGNALKFTPVGGSVAVRVRLKASEVTLEVEDDGPGIGEEEVDQLFDRFFRGRSAATAETGGSGLGLSVTKAIVDAHGGTVEVDTALGEGTRMIVRLPLLDR